MGFQDFGDFGHPRHPAIQTTGLLTLALAGISPAEHTSVYWSQHPDRTLSRHPALTPQPPVARLVPTDKQFGVPSRDASQPVHRRAFSAFEPLKLPSRPLSEGLVEMPEHLNALRAVEPPVVVQPAPYHRVGEARQVLQALVIPSGRHPPFADGLTYRLGGLGADRRQEIYEKLPPPVLRSSRMEGVPEEVELDILVRSPAVIIPAVHDLGLCWM